MNDSAWAFAATTLLAATLILGAAMAPARRRYHVAVFTLHKLTALGGTAAAAVMAIRLIKAGALTGLLPVVSAAGGLSAIALFLSGALMSARKGAYHGIRALHWAASALLILAQIAVTVRFYAL